MRSFWPSFFLFLITVFVLIALFSNELMMSALVFLGSFMMILLYAILCGAVVIGGIVAYAIFQRYSNEARRPVDGAFPLQKKRLRGGATMYVNPNMMIGAAAIVDRDGNYTEPEHPAGWHAVGAVRAAVENTNRVRAMFPGDAARKNQYGAMSGTPRLTAGAMRALDHETPQRKQIAMQEDAPKRLAMQANAKQAFAQNTDCKFALGTDIATGEIVQVDFAMSPHVRLHGATQASGKTNACKTLVYAAMAKGHHAIICDRRRFKDWGECKNIAEMIPTHDPARFVDVLDALLAEHQKRDRYLGENHLANVGEVNLQRYFVMVSEFGALCTVAKAEGVYDNMTQALSLLMREAGACGIHFIFEDQMIAPKTWPSVCVGQSLGIVGRMDSRAGQTVGYYHSDKLESYTFYMDGQTIRTWDMRREGRALLDRAKPIRGKLITESATEGGRSKSVPNTRSNPVPAPRSRAFPPVTPPPPVAGTLEWERVGIEDDQYWEGVVARWFAKHPQALTGEPKGISSLAKAMSKHDEGTDAAYKRYKSRASRLYHAYRESHDANTVDPPTAADQLAAMGINWNDVEVRGRKVR